MSQLFILNGRFDLLVRVANLPCLNEKPHKQHDSIDKIGMINDIISNFFINEVKLLPIYSSYTKSIISY